MDKSIYTKQIATTELTLNNKTVIVTIHSTADNQMGCLLLKYRNNRLRGDYYFGYDIKSKFDHKTIIAVVTKLENGLMMLSWNHFR